MARFAFFIYRFNGPIMGSLFRRPRNVFQIEQGVISMLAGDLFDSPKVVRRLRLFKFIYTMTANDNISQYSGARLQPLAAKCPNTWVHVAPEGFERRTGCVQAAWPLRVSCTPGCPGACRS